MLLKSVTKGVKKLFPSKRSTASVHRQEEILHLKRRLEDFSIQFDNLANRTSSTETQNLMEISKTIAQNKDLLNTLSAETELVVQQQHLLDSHVGITPKILEENHQFIVTMAHILSGPYPFLRKFISSSKT